MSAILASSLVSGVPVAFSAHPMGGDPWRGVAAEGQSLAAIVAAVPNLPAWFEDYGTVCVGGHPVPRAYWSRRPAENRLSLIPKARAHDPVWITLHIVPQGGRSTKSIVSIVAAVALVAVGTFITGGGLAGLGGLAPGLFGAGSASASLLAVGVTTLGRLALTLLSPPAGRDNADTSAPVIGSAGASGNAIQPGGAIARVLGKLKIYPSFGSLPLVELNGDDETVEAAYLLAGPHRIRDIRIEGSPIADIDGLQYLADDGLGTDPVTILGRYGLQRSPNFELQGYRRDLDNPNRLKHQTAPESDTPRWRIEVTAPDPDEIWLQLTWPAGMTNSAANPAVAMPFRLRMREAGTKPWTNLPELMFRHNQTGTITKKIVLKFGSPPSPILDQAETHGAWQSFHNVPASSGFTPSGLGAWTAAASFVGTGGINNATARVVRAYDGFTVYLDNATFPGGKRWEVGVIRGALFKIADFNPPDYHWIPGSLGDVKTFFDYETSGGFHIVPTSVSFYNDTIIDRVVLSRFASVKNQVPLPEPGHARIEVRGRAIQVSQLSCVAQAYVPDWDGSEWTGSVTSSNPAVHLRDVMAGQFSDEPVEESQLNSDELVAFRSRCIAQGYEVAMSVDGQGWFEVMQSIAATGFGRVRPGSRWGVAYDRDASAETPTQIFSGRNAANVTLEKPFTPLDDAFRVSYRNRDNDWAQEELLVVRPGLTLDDVSRIVPVQAVGLDTAAAVTQRFAYDLRSGEVRDSTISFETAPEGLLCQMGDLIGVSHRMLSRHHASARIAAIETNGSGDILALRLDNSHDEGSDQSLALIADLASLADLGAQGVELAATIVRADLSQITAVITQAGLTSQRLVFAAPVSPTGIARQNLVFAGPSSLVTGRYLVREVTGAKRFNCRVTAVPEAPELWA